MGDPLDRLSELLDRWMVPFDKPPLMASNGVMLNPVPVLREAIALARAVRVEVDTAAANQVIHDSDILYALQRFEAAVAERIGDG